MDTSALTKSTLFGGVLQIAMVLLAKFVPSIGGGDTFLPAVGTALAALTGIRYARMAAAPTTGGAAGGGLLAGGLSSLIGSGLAGAFGLAQGTAIPQLLLMAGGSGAAAGLVGGLVGKFFPGTRK